MIISQRLDSIPDSYFGKTMGRKIEHGPLPLINMAVGIPDGETPKGIVDCFAQAVSIPENQKYGAFMVKPHLDKLSLIFIIDIMMCY